MTKLHYGYNATTGHMRPIAHAGELGGDEVLRVVPEGWQLVPVEPTREMEDRASIALSGSIGGYESGLVLKAWEAMIAAAPKPEDAQ